MFEARCAYQPSLRYNKCRSGEYAYALPVIQDENTPSLINLATAQCEPIRVAREALSEIRFADPSRRNEMIQAYFEAYKLQMACTRFIRNTTTVKPQVAGDIVQGEDPIDYLKLRGLLNAYHLPIGSVIQAKGREIDEVLGFVREELAELSGVIKNVNRGKFVDDYIQELARKYHFIGKFGDSTMTILPDDTSIIPSPKDDVDRKRVFTALTAQELYSTGRGMIGHLFIESTVFKRNSGGIYTAHREISGVKGANAMAALVTASQLGWAERKINGLIHTVSAGLPSLGKRR